MANSDKVQQAIPLMRMIKRLDDVVFSLDSQSGFFLSIGGNRIMEFQNNSDGTIMVSSLNTAIQPIVDNVRNKYENKIGNIIA